jgi:hypothetical protein
MDRTNHEADAGGPPIRMLMLAASMPFCVLGLLALPMAFSFLRQLVGV